MSSSKLDNLSKIDVARAEAKALIEAAVTDSRFMTGAEREAVIRHLVEGDASCYQDDWGDAVEFALEVLRTGFLQPYDWQADIELLEQLRDGVQDYEPVEEPMEVEEGSLDHLYRVFKKYESKLEVADAGTTAVEPTTAAG